MAENINVSSLINAYYSRLNLKEQSVADHIRRDPIRVVEGTISDLAKETEVSPATITRLIHHLDFDSYRDFRSELTRLVNQKVDSTVDFPETFESSMQAVARRTFDEASIAFEQTVNLLNEETLTEIVDKISNAGQIGFYGLGGSSVVALSAYHKFLRTGIPCQHNIDFDIQLMQASQMKKGDVAIIISHTGRNTQTELIEDVLVEQGVTIIAISSFANSPIAQKARYKLISVSEETKMRNEGITSELVQIGLIQSLFLMVMIQDNTGIEGVRRVIKRTRTKK